MKATKNKKDIESKINLKVHNIGAGGISILGRTGLAKMSKKRFYQECFRCNKINLDEMFFILGGKLIAR